MPLFPLSALRMERNSLPVLLRVETESSAVFQPVVPQTSQEWKQALADVKRDYLNRRHRHCSSRCRQLLGNVKAYSTAEPVHLIYLHFYAASALEMQANSLHHSSPHKAHFIQQARDHYRRASVITEAESESALQPPLRHSSISSSSSASSAYTPVLSEGTGGASTRSSSPTLTFLLDEDEDDEDLEAMREKMLRKQHRKQVSFGGVSYATDPFVRPDSPTLGSDGCFGRWSPDQTSPCMQTDFTLRHQLPLVSSPKAPPPPPPPISPISPASAPFSTFQEALEEAARVEEPYTEQTPQHTHALRRYSSSLGFLQQQIAAHMSDLEAKSKLMPSVTSYDTSAGDEMRELDLAARIARLKGNSWRRQRFDPTRYQALREAALADPS